LDNFQAAKGERELGEILKAARAYANSFNSSEPLGLLLRGIPGSGKTHIAVGIMHIVLQRGYTARYDNFSDLLSRIRESFSPDSDWSEAELLENVNKADLLVLDDLGAESTSDWVRDRLYLIINRRYESGRAVIITTNCDEHELSARVGERTASRLCEMCQVPFPPFPKVDWRRKMMH
jgi:DNA replication protein DnaC